VLDTSMEMNRVTYGQARSIAPSFGVANRHNVRLFRATPNGWAGIFDKLDQTDGTDMALRMSQSK